MKIMTISEVTKTFNVTTRMLRYYDEIGLLRSSRKEDYAYRAYDQTAVRCLQQILTLRKLRIPLKKIALIFENPEQQKIIEVFQESVSELDGEISALGTIRDILCMFIARISSAANINVKLDLFDDAEIVGVIQTLSLSKINLKEECSMDELNKASEKITRLTQQDVRIIYIPPMSVASSHYIGQDSEGNSYRMLNEFIARSNLFGVKPDTRHFGFNNPIQPMESTGMPSSGYEMWASIPDDMNVPPPLVKKRFSGGLYAAHCIKMGDFDHWGLLGEWVKNSVEYEHDWGAKRCTPYSENQDWCFEEQLNFINNAQDPDFNGNTMQLDLLFPIKKRAK